MSARHLAVALAVAATVSAAGTACAEALPRRVSDIATQATQVVGRDELRELVQRALARSAAIREVRAALEAATLDVREARGARYPQVGLDVSSRWSRGPSSSRSAELSGDPYYTAQATMPLWDGGKVANQVASRQASQRAALERLRGLAESIASETAAASSEVARQRDLLLAAEVYQSRIERLAGMLERVIREDPGRSGELSQVRSRLLQAQVARAAIESRLREAEIALVRLLGSSDGELASVPYAFATPPTLPEVLERAADSPLLRQIDAEAQAQAGNARAIGSARLPQLNAVVARTPLSPGLSNGYSTSAGVVLSYPLYRGGSDVAAERAAEMRASGLRERHDQATTDLVTRLRTLHQVAVSRLAQADEHVRLLAESTRVRRDFFELWERTGRRTLFELLAIESEHHALRSAYLNMLHDGLAASARLRSESGRMLEWLGLGVAELAGPLAQAASVPDPADRHQNK